MKAIYKIYLKTNEEQIEMAKQENNEFIKRISYKKYTKINHRIDIM